MPRTSFWKKMIFLTRNCHPKMIVLRKMSNYRAVPILGKLKNLKTFVQNEQEPNFDSRKNAFKKPLLYLTVSVARQPDEAESWRGNRKFPFVLKRCRGVALNTLKLVISICAMRRGILFMFYVSQGYTKQTPRVYASSKRSPKIGVNY